METAERRQAQRIALDIPVEVRMVSGMRKRASIINLCEQGARFFRPYYDQDCCPANEALLEFSLPDDSGSVRAWGWVVDEIVHENYLETAVSFEFLPSEDRMRIKHFIEQFEEGYDDHEFDIDLALL